MAARRDTRDDPGKSETAGALYAAWIAWAKATGETPGTQRLFAAALGLTRVRSEFARFYKGVRLIKEEEKRPSGLMPDVS